MMPGMDGWAVLAALKADPALADIPVVMLTIVDDRNMGFALGASDYLTKPIDRDRLAAVLADATGRAPGAGAGRRGRRGDPRSCSARRWRRRAGRCAEAENGRVALERLADARARADPARPDDAGDGRLRVPRRAARTARGVARRSRSSSSPPRTSPRRTASGSTAPSRRSSRRAHSSREELLARCATWCEHAPRTRSASQLAARNEPLDEERRCPRSCWSKTTR